MKEFIVKIKIPSSQTSMAETARILRVLANRISILAVDEYTINGPDNHGMDILENCRPITDPVLGVARLVKVGDRW